MPNDESLVQEWFRRQNAMVGERLPAERVLAETLGLSRAGLRKGLAALEAQGLLVRQVGRGTFVQSPPNPSTAASDMMITDGVDASPREIMTARVILEPRLARFAAVDGNRDRCRFVESAEAAARGASDWETYDRADTVFHRSIALASGNPLLVRLFDDIIAAVETVAWARLRRRDLTPFARPEDALRDHAAIASAIRMRDPDAAGEAMTRHLLAETAALVGQAV